MRLPVNFSFRRTERRDGAGPRLRVRQHFESFGRAGDVIGMAHPADAAGGNAVEKRSFFQDADLPSAVFARPGVGDFAAQRVRDELAAVADAEHGDAERKDLRGDVGGILRIDAVGPAREDDADGIIRPDLLYRHVAGFQIAVDVEVAHPPRDELVVLSAEVEDENSFVFFHNFSDSSFRRIFMIF